MASPRGAHAPPRLVPSARRARPTAVALLAALGILLAPTSGRAQDAADVEAPDETATPPAPSLADDLDAPPEPVSGRAVVEHDPGELLPPSWQPRQPPPAPARSEAQPRLPGDYTARPLVLPAGTFQVAFDVTSVFLDASPLTTYLPNLALGLAPGVELGAAVPTRYDRGENDWTSLDPAPYLAVRFVDEERVEVGARASVLIPASSDARPNTELSVPVLWRPVARFRIDASPGVELAFDERVETVVRLPLGVSVQAADWFFTGVRATVDVGVSSQRESSVDGEVFVGLTVQSKNIAYFDLLGRFFVANIGGGGRSASSDGGGFGASVRFYPSAF